VKKPEAPKAEPVKPEPVKAEPVKPAAPKVEKPKAEKPKAEKPRAEKPKAEKKVAASKTYAPAEPGSVEEKIEVFLKGLLERMGSNAVPHCWKEEGNSYKVDLVGDDLGYLIGRRGDTLDALQHLTNYTVNRDVEGHIRVNVDAEAYRQKREDSLRRYARKKAQQVLKARRRTTLEPMNAYERHVIHSALQDMENITTHSTGTEPNRRVVIEYVR
jgi:spoIIIJ-associated protein